MPAFGLERIECHWSEISLGSIWPIAPKPPKDNSANGDGGQESSDQPHSHVSRIAWRCMVGSSLVECQDTMIGVWTPIEGIDMAGTSSKSQKFEMRVPIATLDAWKMLATANKVSVAAFVIGRMDAVPVLHRQIEGLNEAGDAARREIAALQTDVANLKRELAKRPTVEAVASQAVPVQMPQPRDVDASVHHVSGPVLTDPVPRAVSGEAQPFFKPRQRAALDVVGQEKGKR